MTAKRAKIGSDALTVQRDARRFLIAVAIGEAAKSDFPDTELAAIIKERVAPLGDEPVERRAHNR